MNKIKTNFLEIEELPVTGDGGVQVHRGQGCVPKVLQQDAGKEAGKTDNLAIMLNITCVVL